MEEVRCWLWCTRRITLCSICPLRCVSHLFSAAHSTQTPRTTAMSDQLQTHFRPPQLMYLPVLVPMVLVSNGLAQNPTFIWPMIFVNVGSWCVPTLADATLSSLLPLLILAPKRENEHLTSLLRVYLAGSRRSCRTSSSRADRRLCWTIWSEVRSHPSLSTAISSATLLYRGTVFPSRLRFAPTDPASICAASPSPGPRAILHVHRSHPQDDVLPPPT